MPPKSKYSIDYTPKGSRLVFIKETETKRYGVGKRWSSFRSALYKCTCGKEKEMFVVNVQSGKTLSCGCLARETTSKNRTIHGLSKHPLFMIWAGIIVRCENKNDPAYQYYGALGVRMCKEWRFDFKAFYDWAIASGWERGKEVDKDKIPIERRIKAKVYGPEFCSILTRKENHNNRKNSCRITFNGKTQHISEWGEEFGISRNMIYDRLYCGWSVKRALSTPKPMAKK